MDAIGPGRLFLGIRPEMPNCVIQAVFATVSMGTIYRWDDIHAALAARFLVLSPKMLLARILIGAITPHGPTDHIPRVQFPVYGCSVNRQQD